MNAEAPARLEPIGLDVHAHLVPVRPERLAGIAGVSWDAAAERLVIDGHELGLKPLLRPAALLGWMDAKVVAKAWISVPPPLYRPGLAAAPARIWTDYLDDGLAALAQAQPDRFAPLLHLPVEHPEIAAEVAARWIGRGQWRFAMAAGAGPNVMLSAAAYEPLWQVLDAAAAFLFFHPGEGCDPRLDPFYLHNLLGNPYETGVAAAHLVLGGVLERHPRLTICLAHGGGVTPMVAGRLERGQATRRPGIDPAAEAPRRALRRLCVDCILHDRAALALAAAVHGENNLLFGSDWPFPMGLPEPHQQLADLAPELRRAIFQSNPARLLTRG